MTNQRPALETLMCGGEARCRRCHSKNDKPTKFVSSNADYTIIAACRNDCGTIDGATAPQLSTDCGTEHNGAPFVNLAWQYDYSCACHKSPNSTHVIRSHGYECAGVFLEYLEIIKRFSAVTEEKKKKKLPFKVPYRVKFTK